MIRRPEPGEFTPDEEAAVKVIAHEDVRRVVAAWEELGEAAELPNNMDLQKGLAALGALDRARDTVLALRAAGFTIIRTEG